MKRGRRLHLSDAIEGRWAIVEKAWQACSQHQVEMPNRDFLLELCIAHGLDIANTFCNVPVEKQVTYHEPGVPPLAPVTAGSFSVLDILLAPREYLHHVKRICSDRLATLASSHFPVTAVLQASLTPAGPNGKTSQRRDWSALLTPSIRRKFSADVTANLSCASVSDPNAFWEKACSAVESAVQKHVPFACPTTNRPWISPRTLDLLHQRRTARMHGQWNAEKRLRAEVKKSAKHDRSRWLEDLASSGNWRSIKKLQRC